MVIMQPTKDDNSSKNQGGDDIPNSLYTFTGSKGVVLGGMGGGDS